MCPLSVAFGVEIGSPRVSPLLGIGTLHVGLSTLGRVIVPCLNHHPAQDPHGVKAEDWKDFLSRPRGQLRVAPEARALFPLQMATPETGVMGSQRPLGLEVPLG